MNTSRLCRAIVGAALFLGGIISTTNNIGESAISKWVYNEVQYSVGKSTLIGILIIAITISGLCLMISSLFERKETEVKSPLAHKEDDTKE